MPTWKIIPKRGDGYYYDAVLDDGFLSARVYGDPDDHDFFSYNLEIKTNMGTSTLKHGTTLGSIHYVLEEVTEIYEDVINDFCKELQSAVSSISIPSPKRKRLRRISRRSCRY